MGQAKNRGSFEQRQAESIESKNERDRLDAWLKSRQPVRKRRRVSALTIAGCMISSGVIPIYSHEELARRRR